jgi:hypothetical protein
MSVLNTPRSLPDSKLESSEKQGLPNEIWFYEAKLKLQQFTGMKGPIRKIKNPIAVLS